MGDAADGGEAVRGAADGIQAYQLGLPEAFEEGLVLGALQQLLMRRMKLGERTRVRTRGTARGCRRDPG